jgi:hypothetical protein
MDNKILYTAKFTHYDLKFIKFGGNRTKDVEVGPDRRTDRQTDRQTDRFLYITPNYVCGGIIIK